MLLAIDTSTHISSIALYDAHGVLGEVTRVSHQNHTRSLVPEVVRLIEVVGTNVDQLRAIGVATGPGSFTGLRIGLSAAKGLAFSLNAALVGVPTLDVCASASKYALPVCAVLQAGRGRYAVALYDTREEPVRRTSDYLFGTAEQIARQLSGPICIADSQVLVVGEVDEPLRAQLRERLNDFVVLANDAANVRRAGYLAALAWRRWQADDVDDLQTLVPYYIPTASLA